MTNQNSQDLANSMDESKIQMMVDKCVNEIMNPHQPSNAEIIVFSLVVIQSMLKRALETRMPYPKKMQVGSDSGHLITLDIIKPTATLGQVSDLINNKH